ncbi:MAG: efflux transporter periplasmic adaptor subunit [Flavobacteriaceae bacterium]|nr:efflux transporter periplasmic adaptor subunit [Flavobacteriaceae bacterium]
MIRKIISSLLGVVLLGGSYAIASNIISANKRERLPAQKVVKSVFVLEAKNAEVPIKVLANGRLTAKRRVQLFAEVQGILRPAAKLYRPGQNYRKGDLLLSIDDTEFRASVQSAKSNFINVLTTSLADIEIDFPQYFQKWMDYLNAINMNRPLPELPEFNSPQEAFFINGRGIPNAYYNVLNLQTRLAKYKIRAPFTGSLASTSITEGSLVRAGQNLGSYIESGVYELEVAVPSGYSSILKLGRTVVLELLEGSQTYQGRVTRINPSIDANTQSISVFVEVKSEDLREGQYLRAVLDAAPAENAIEIDRSLLVDQRQIYTVEDTLLKLMDVEIVHLTDQKAVVKGVEDGTLFIRKPVAGAFTDMLVKIVEE